jgi:hypothetical protein
MSAQDSGPTVAPLLNPDLAIQDALAAWWLDQVTLRLRREVAWCRHQRGEETAPGESLLPAAGDPAQESLDLMRHRHARRAFFQSDVAARYLSERIAAVPPPETAGCFARTAQALALDPAARFVLAFALAARVDAALGPVCAACQNDNARPYPTLALAQRLWDEPLALTACGDASHPLFRFGLIAWPAGAGALDWQAPLDMPAPVARSLLAVAGRAAPAASAPPLDLPPAARAALANLTVHPPRAGVVVPLVGPHHGDFAAWAALASAAAGRALTALPEHFPHERSHLFPTATACWLEGRDILLPEGWAERPAHAAEPWFPPVAALPLRWYLPVSDLEALKGLPAAQLAVSLQVPALGFRERLAILTDGLGSRATDVAAALPEAARRFRFERATLERVVRTLKVAPERISVEQLYAGLRAEVTGELGHLAQAVAPRFSLAEVVLPAREAAQLAEIAAAMKALARVHYDWGTARAWNEGGLAVLFCGQPGTGKTMAAEALAAELDLPLYRIDLSQVVNKYIGETEKNLKRVFDAAERADTILLFDEADALFGRRAEVKDAHDRFANIEVSYLLERMERFKGLAILATNRRKDLDEAFTRRLRYLVEFPIPGARERERIWGQMFAPPVDASALDFPYLGEQFELSGGHIRSAAFNACLQAAAGGAARRVDMPQVLNAVRREYQKLDRLTGAAQFGVYAPLMEGLL